MSQVNQHIFTATAASPQTAQTSPPQAGTAPTFTASKDNAFTVEFGEITTADIDRLIKHMRKDGVAREDVVLTGLQLLALSYENDLTIESALRAGTLRISDLWKPERD